MHFISDDIKLVSAVQVANINDFGRIDSLSV